ncbi:hypothetical protein HanIR_Chr01g0018441 [Helianthus annuus]|nr:hypothetical protein HanIR_Chr01g0018441 [Helianthus annuus]
MDGLTTSCTVAGVSVSPAVGVTPRQPIALIALSGDCRRRHLPRGVSHLPGVSVHLLDMQGAVRAASLHAVTSEVTASPTCDQEIREMRCWPHHRMWRLFARFPCRDENGHMMRCQPHRYVHLLSYLGQAIHLRTEWVRRM